MKDEGEKRGEAGGEERRKRRKRTRRALVVGPQCSA
jgi:hypothetical protein